MATQSRLLTPKRLRLYPMALLLGLFLGAFFVIGSSRGLRTPNGGRIGGDFPAFYGAGRIVLRGDAADLYDGQTQRRAQADVLPDTKTSWIHFAYPPFVAVAYAPFAALPFLPAYLLHTLLMIGCTALACRWIMPTGDYQLLCIAAVLLCYPMAVANFGGQNAALSLLCAAGAWKSLEHEHDAWAGAWLGLWCFKPQLALPVALLLTVRHPRVLIGLGATAIGWYLAGAAVGGWLWLAWWLRAAQSFASADAGVDVGRLISLPALGSIGWIIAVAVLGIALWQARHLSPRLLVGMACVTALLVSPHTLYYDAGIAAIAVAAVGSWRWALAAWIASWLALIAPAVALTAPLMALFAYFASCCWASHVPTPVSASCT